MLSTFSRSVRLACSRLHPYPQRSPISLFQSRRISIESIKNLFIKSAKVENRAEDFVEFVKCDAEEKNIFLRDFAIFPDFIPKRNYDALVKDSEEKLCKRFYETLHWDGVINMYRELQVNPALLSQESQSFIDHTKKFIESRSPQKSPIKWLDEIHLLDLLPEGEIRYHIDHTEVFGNSIATMSLLSDAIMEFENRKSGAIVRAFVPARSLYIMRDSVRYNFGHAILPNNSTFNDRVVRREKRIAVILRTKLNDSSIAANIYGS